MRWGDKDISNVTKHYHGVLLNFLLIKESWKMWQSFHKNIKQHNCFQLLIFFSWAPDEYEHIIMEKYGEKRKQSMEKYFFPHFVFLTEN